MVFSTFAYQYGGAWHAELYEVFRHAVGAAWTKGELMRRCAVCSDIDVQLLVVGPAARDLLSGAGLATTRHSAPQQTPPCRLLVQYLMQFCAVGIERIVERLTRG